MTGDEILSTYVRLTADLYQQLELEQAEHHSTRVNVDELRAEMREKDRLNAELHEHIAVLERPRWVPTCGNPPL